MDKLLALHSQLRLAAGLLDDVARLVRDAPLEPTGAHIHKIGEALACVFEIRHAVEAIRPEFAATFEVAPEETRAANRRLGPLLIAAYDLEAAGESRGAIEILESYAEAESSELHRNIAFREAQRLRSDNAI
jgi:hypothetical protein